MKTCPRCAEKIADSAKICRFCGHAFGAADVAAAERAAMWRAIIKAGVVVGAVLFVVRSCDVPQSQAPSISAEPEQLSDSVQAKCKALIDQAAKAGMVKARPAGNRIDVDETAWAAADSQTKRVLLQAVSCEAWATNMPPESQKARKPDSRGLWVA